MVEYRIEMVPFHSSYLIPKSGKYLVKAESVCKAIKGYQYLSVNCTISGTSTTIDISNQKVLMISKNPLNS